MFDDIYIVQLRKKSEVILNKMSEGHPLSNEEMNTLILYGLNNHYHDMEEKILVEIKSMRCDMDKRFEQVDKRFEQVDKRFEQLDKRFERIYIFLYWIFGSILAALGIGFSAIGFLR